MTRWVTRGTRVSSPQTKAPSKVMSMLWHCLHPRLHCECAPWAPFLLSFRKEEPTHTSSLRMRWRVWELGLHLIWQVQAVWTATVDKQVETWDAGGSVTGSRLAGSTKRCIRQQHSNEEQSAPSTHGMLSPAPHTRLVNQDWPLRLMR